MSRKLDDLHPQFRPFVYEWLARCVEDGIALMVVDTLRTPAEHADNLARGVSWTQRSKHLADAAGYSHAIDVAPFSTYQLAGPDKLQWNGADSVWRRIADHAKAVAARQGVTIRCGIDWQRTPDPGHVEWVRPVGAVPA